MASRELIDIIIKAEDLASDTARKVDENLHKIGETTSRLSRIPGFDAMKTKLSSVATTIDSKFGGALTKARNHFNRFKTSVSNVASGVKSKFGGAIDGIRNKLSGFAKANKNAGASLGFLKGAASMAVGMIGYDLLNSLIETTRASLNARSSMQSFAKRLKMSGTEVSDFQKSLDELQDTYKKIDMDVVGQQATDMAYRLGLPKESLSELTETTAIFTDAMQRNGRSAEDSMLAMSDAMDGQFVRLKEIGIGQDDLMKNGWSGDLNDKKGLLDAMNKALKEQHYDDLAKSVDTLDDAWQVLSITLSNLLEQIIVPLTPVIVGVINAVTDGAKQIRDTWNNLPDWGKIAVAIGAIGLAIAMIAPALMAMEAASLPIIGTLITAIGALTWPIVAVVAAIALIGAAIFEVGKAFGWWKDVGTMFEAITAGLQRMWSAFINHPDVQAAIKWISEAFQGLVTWIGEAWQQLLEFFNISSDSNFDIVHELIMAIGAAFDWVKGIIEAILPTLTVIYDTIVWVVTTVWSIISPFVFQIVGFIQNIILAIDNFKNGQMDLPSFVMTILTNLGNIFMSFTAMVVSLIVAFAKDIITRAVSAGKGFVNGIMSYLKSLPGKVYSALMNVVSRIISAGSQWVTNAKKKALDVVNGAYNTLKGLPGKVGDALNGVKDAIVKPFQDAYNTAKGWWDKITNLDLPTGGETLSDAMGGETALDVNGESFNISSGQYIVEADNTPIEINDNINLVLDLRNVPPHINTGQLIEALNDKNVLSAIANNRDFQDVDARVKQKINMKNVRARGR